MGNTAHENVMLESKHYNCRLELTGKTSFRHALHVCLQESPSCICLSSVSWNTMEWQVRSCCMAWRANYFHIPEPLISVLQIIGFFFDQDLSSHQRHISHLFAYSSTKRNSSNVSHIIWLNFRNMKIWC